MIKLLPTNPVRIRVPAPGTHIPALDGIRGLAILLVMLYHFILYSDIEPARFLDRLPTKVGLAGWMGVDLFFVLSGFLITGILFDTKNGRNFFRNFYMRRVLRIFPLYYTVLIIFFLVIPKLFSVSTEYQSLLRNQGWYWSYLSNISIALKGWDGSFPIGHFWSLAIEEQFYLVWPLVIYLFQRCTLVKICLALIIGGLILRMSLSIAGYHHLVSYAITLTRMDTLALGAFLALVVRGSRADWLKLYRWAWPVAGLSSAIILVYSIWKQRLAYGDIQVYTVGFSVIALLFGAILIISITVPPETPLGKFFNSSILRFFGKYSYALYVFHQPIAIYLPKWGFSTQTLPIFMNSQLPALLSFITGATVLSLGLALLSWHLLEVHFLSLKYLFSYRQNKPSTKHVKHEVAKV